MRENTFEDLISLDDNFIRKIVREVPSKNLAQALNFTTEEIQEKFFRNMTEKIVPLLKELMSVLGTHDLEECLSSQAMILSVWEELEESDKKVGV